MADSDNDVVIVRNDDIDDIGPAFVNAPVIMKRFSMNGTFIIKINVILNYWMVIADYKMLPCMVMLILYQQ